MVYSSLNDSHKEETEMRLINKITSSRSGFAFISNPITLLVAVVLFRPFWEECDDVNMALLAEGAYGYQEPHLLYSNIIYGKILCSLGAAIPSVRWHAVLMYLFTFIISTAFVYILAKDKKGRVLSVVFLAAAFYEVYVSFQFSKVATFIAILAYLILFALTGTVKSTGPAETFPKEKKSRRIMYVIAMICMTFSIILRFESFLLATLVAGAYGICLIINDIACKELSVKLKSYCKCFIPVFAIFGICFGIHLYSYSFGEWKEYMDYFNSTTQMVDYHFNSLLYDLHGEELAKLGVSENDALMFITYQGGGAAFPTTELMDKISALDKISVNGDFIKAWIANICGEIFTMNSLIIGLIMVIGVFAAYALGDDNKKLYSACIILQSVLAVLVLFYYQYSNRWSHRIVFSLILAEFALFIYMTGNLKSLDLPKPAIVSVLAIVIFAVIGQRFSNEFSYNEYKRDAYDYNQLIAHMEDSKDKLYVADVFTMNDYGKYDIFRASQPGQFDNFLSTDSVYMVGTPVNAQIAAKFGYKDPLDALKARDDRVILADCISPEVELTYCNEHGDQGEYSLNELPPAGNVMLYSIR